ncbi:MAG: patatin-like phospholipase family protein [Candidatus Dormibacteria bacterium]
MNSPATQPASAHKRHSTANQAMLKDHQPVVDRGKIGISYSGGGPRFVHEIGAARAFIRAGIVPDAIAGVSAGGIAAVAHVVDPVGGRGIEAAIREIPRFMSTRGLGLTMEGLIERVIRHRTKLQSFGDNATMRGLSRAFFSDTIGEEVPLMGRFVPPSYPHLLVAASDWLAEDALWFDGETPVEEALLASSAIPGVFPWRHHDSAAGHAVLVDGGVISNQPLSRLVMEGCGTIFACGFSSPPRTGVEPGSALHNILDSIQMMMRQCSHLEEDYVRLKLGGAGDLHRLFIDGSMPSHSYDFTPATIQQLIDDADGQVTAQLKTLGYSS